MNIAAIDFIVKAVITLFRQELNLILILDFILISDQCQKK